MEKNVAKWIDNNNTVESTKLFIKYKVENNRYVYTEYKDG